MFKNDAHNESALLQLLAAGDETAFEQLFRLYQPQVFKAAYLYVKSRPLSEEIVQDVFARVWTNREQLPEVKDFKAWLFIVSRNHIVNCLEKLARERTARIVWDRRSLHDNAGTDHKVREAEINGLLQQAILHLPEQQQRVFRLAREQFLTYDQIALRMGLSPHTVRTHMSKALAGIRRFLEAHEVSYVLLAYLFCVA